MDNKLVVGFITYNDLTAKYLPDFSDSLKKQSRPDFRLIAVDHSDQAENDNVLFLRKNCPEIEIDRPGKNLGFAAGFNRMIRRAIDSGAEYFLALNPDMILDKDFVAAMVKAAEADKTIGAVAPKILKWDFANNKKTDIIDSRGLSITREHRFSDTGQAEKDNGGQEAREVFGFTGAAVIFRIEALKDIAYDKIGEREFFDELMFMYKEDCDLSYRLRLAGWRIVFEPKAVIYHDRTASPQGESNLKIAFNRRNKSRQVKRWSFLNQWILILKYRRMPFSFRVKLATVWYQLKSLVFALIFETYLLKELYELWKMRAEIRNKREQLKIRVDIAEIERFMI
ncbi:MAG: glycosyltransferase family 2 protein [Candidatus Falkowbacteria bacterium]